MLYIAVNVVAVAHSHHYVLYRVTRLCAWHLMYPAVLLLARALSVLLKTMLVRRWSYRLQMTAANVLDQRLQLASATWLLQFSNCNPWMQLGCPCLKFQVALNSYLKYCRIMISCKIGFTLCVYY